MSQERELFPEGGCGQELQGKNRKHFAENLYRFPGQEENALTKCGYKFRDKIFMWREGGRGALTFTSLFLVSSITVFYVFNPKYYPSLSCTSIVSFLFGKEKKTRISRDLETLRQVM